MIDKIYIVTIDNTQQNYNECLGRLDYMTLPHQTIYEFRGVNGRELFKTTKGLTNRGYRAYPKWNIGDTDNYFWNREMTPGEFGCMTSHIEIWEDAYRNGYKNILVLEDDFEPNNPMDWSFLENLNKIDWDLFYLGRILQNGYGISDTPTEYDNIVEVEFSYQTHAYMLSGDGIRKIVEDHLPTLKNNLIPADEFLPAVYGKQIREDIQSMYNPNINAYGLPSDNLSITQLRCEPFGNSLTAPQDD